MDAFDQILDEASAITETISAFPQSKQGRAKGVEKTAVRTPAPTNPEKPARKAGKTKDKIPTETSSSFLSSSPIPRKRGRPDIFDEKTSRELPDVTNSEKPAAKSARRKANHSLGTDTPTPSVNNSDIAFQVFHESQKTGESDKDGVRSSYESQLGSDSVHPISDGQGCREGHLMCAIGTSDRVGHVSLETQGGNSDAVAIIQAQWRMRQRWHKAEKSLVLQSKAICRGFTDGDKTEANDMFDKTWKAFVGKAGIETVNPQAMRALTPFLPAIQRFEQERALIEKSIVKLAKTLPAYEWAMSQRGIDKGFAWIIGEAGDVGSYKSVSALWKRMGLAVFDGERQRKKTNAEEALLHGYSPSRRSVMWNVGCSLIGAMGRGPRPSPGEDISQREDWSYWQKLFVERCRYECQRDPENMPLKIVEKGDEQRESYTKHTQSRAKRYVEKRFLRKLYAQWRLETLGEVEPEFVPLPLAAE
jgi:hypothetical protein